MKAATRSLETLVIREKNCKDEISLETLERNYRDEIGHVRFGLKWFKHICSIRQLIPIEEFHKLSRQYFKGKLKELEEVIKPYISKMYDGSDPNAPNPTGMPTGGPSAANPFADMWKQMGTGKDGAKNPFADMKMEDMEKMMKQMGMAGGDGGDGEDDVESEGGSSEIDDNIDDKTTQSNPSVEELD